MKRLALQGFLCCVKSQQPHRDAGRLESAGMGMTAETRGHMTCVFFSIFHAQNSQVAESLKKHEFS